MFEYYFTFRALTPAQSARNVLLSNGIGACVDRAPRKLSSNGCGYVLRVAAQNGLRTASLLRSAGFGHIYRVYHGGATEEVRF